MQTDDILDPGEPLLHHLGSCWGFGALLKPLPEANGSFNIFNKLLIMFYQSIITSVFFYAVVCWRGNTKKRDATDWTRW